MENLSLNNQTITKLHKNIINNAKISGNIRKCHWLYKRALKGWFDTVCKNNIEESINFVNHLDVMITKLNQVHGENWDFNLIPENSNDKFERYKILVTILYPEINITNSKEEKHVIHDLITAFEIVNYGKFGNNKNSTYAPSPLYGTKATYSYLEHFNGYVHSHLTTNSLIYFESGFHLSSFCLGNDTEIIEIRESLLTDFSPEIFEMYLYIMNSMVSWESLEGVPYQNIRKLVPSDVVDLNPSVYRKEERYIAYFDWIKLNKHNPFDYLIQNGICLIKDNEKLENSLKEYIINFISKDSWKTLLVKDIGGGNCQGYSAERTESKEELEKGIKNSKGEKPFYYLRTKKIELNITPFNTDKKLNFKHYQVNPKFINYVKQKLDQELHTKQIRKSTIEKKYKVISAG